MRKGFTLIELLLVVVIIGIVASFVLPKFGDVKAKAYKAAMKSDLRNLATAEEIYFDGAGAYDQRALPNGATPVMSMSDNVNVTFSGVTSQGYTASATHGLTSATCSLVIGIGAANKVTCP